ncbi:Ig-like domain-containing protein [Iamia sp.]|uniref:Ig-like domain-containing protein n=1 Tax=Iamia sp. TaxID=2722710 RepID=UPI0039C876F6
MCADTSTSVTSDAATQRPGRPVELTATVTAEDRSWVPTGTVQFRDGGRPLGGPMPLDAAGEASLTTSDLSRGPHTITAAYLPDLTADTSADGSPARTTLTEPCPARATTCAVAGTTGIEVGDTIVMGSGTGTHDSHVITAVTQTSITWAEPFSAAPMPRARRCGYRTRPAAGSARARARRSGWRSASSPTSRPRRRRMILH